jgi:hypothetical protein
LWCAVLETAFTLLTTTNTSWNKPYFFEMLSLTLNLSLYLTFNPYLKLILNIKPLYLTKSVALRRALNWTMILINSSEIKIGSKPGGLDLSRHWQKVSINSWEKSRQFQKACFDDWEVSIKIQKSQFCLDTTF